MWSRKISEFVEANRPQTVNLPSVVVTEVVKMEKKALVGKKTKVERREVKLDSLRVEWQDGLSSKGEAVYYPRISGEGGLLLSEEKIGELLFPYGEVRVPLPEPIVSLPIPPWVVPGTWESYLDCIQVFRSEVEETVASFMEELQALIG